MKVSTENNLWHLSYPNVSKPLPLTILRMEEGKLMTEDVTDDRLILICTNDNLGFAGGNNVALRYILDKDDCDFVWLINNDTVVEPESLSAMVEHYSDNADQSIGLIGCKVKYYHTPTMIQCIAGSYYNKWLGYSEQIGNRQIDKGQFDGRYIRPDLIIGACTLVSTDFLKTVGLMNEEYFLYFEEQDWAKRADIHKFKLSYCDRGTIYHKEGSTIGGGQQRGNSRFSDFYFTRSKLLFTKRYFNWLTYLTVKLSLIFTIINRIRKGQYGRVPMIFSIAINPRDCQFPSNKLR